jgi:hypothetical protein
MHWYIVNLLDTVSRFWGESCASYREKTLIPCYFCYNGRQINILINVITRSSMCLLEIKAGLKDRKRLARVIEYSTWN